MYVAYLGVLRFCIHGECFLTWGARRYRTGHRKPPLAEPGSFHKAIYFWGCAFYNSKLVGKQEALQQCTKQMLDLDRGNASHP
jgi:hypothetical protein